MCVVGVKSNCQCVVSCDFLPAQVYSSLALFSAKHLSLPQPDMVTSSPGQHDVTSSHTTCHHWSYHHYNQTTPTLYHLMLLIETRTQAIIGRLVIMMMKMMSLTLYVPRLTPHYRLSGSGEPWGKPAVTSELINYLITNLCMYKKLYGVNFVSDMHTSPMATGHTPKKKPPPVGSESSVH